MQGTHSAFQGLLPIPKTRVATAILVSFWYLRGWHFGAGVLNKLTIGNADLTAGHFCHVGIVGNQDDGMALSGKIG